MTDAPAPENLPVRRQGLDRRTVLKAGAWAAPVIVLASATPAAAASLDPTDCTVSPSGFFNVGGGSLFINGSTGMPAAPPSATVAPESGWIYRSTGTTPLPVWGEMISAYQATELYGGDLAVGGVGFLSMDDNDNTVANTTQAATTVTTSFTIDAEPGATYLLQLPVNAGTNGHGAQFLEISYSGPGVSGVLARRYYGNKDISVVPDGLEAYTPLTSTQVIPAAIGPVTGSGLLTLTYTFILPYVFDGSRQNADIWVGLPSVLNCAV